MGLIKNFENLMSNSLELLAFEGEEEETTAPESVLNITYTSFRQAKAQYSRAWRQQCLVFSVHSHGQRICFALISVQMMPYTHIVPPVKYSVHVD